MRITEQIDALESLSFNPIAYLVMPRILAAILMFPYLVLIADIFGIIGGMAAGLSSYDELTVEIFINGLSTYGNIQYDSIFGMIKGVFFGFAISSIACYQGYYASGGAAGVGKSTTAVNLALALKEEGATAAILDADIYGPSIPRMMGISGKPELNQNKKLIPLDSYGIKCMSIGFLVSEETPTIWRGPMIMKALEQMFNGVEWGQLDYLIIDLPPGTGDAQITLAQNSKLSGSIIISTPQDVALTDARKGINMFKKVNVPILGLVENMSYFICDNCNEKHFIFSNNGAKKEAEKFQIPFLGSLPIDKKLRIQSDEGRPACIDKPDGDIAKQYLEIAKSIF